MRIFRVEAFDGCGPYHGSSIAEIAGLRYLPTNTHPDPTNDAGLCKAWLDLSTTSRLRMHFGFKDLNQFSNWFLFTYLNMEAAYYGWIVEYEVPEDQVFIGQFQVMFYKKFAKAVGYKHLGTLEELSSDYVNTQRTLHDPNYVSIETTI